MLQTKMHLKISKISWGACGCGESDCHANDPYWELRITKGKDRVYAHFRSKDAAQEFKNIITNK